MYAELVKIELYMDSEQSEGFAVVQGISQELRSADTTAESGSEGTIRKMMEDIADQNEFFGEPEIKQGEVPISVGAITFSVDDQDSSKVVFFKEPAQMKDKGLKGESSVGKAADVLYGIHPKYGPIRVNGILAGRLANMAMPERFVDSSISLSGSPFNPNRTFTGMVKSAYGYRKQQIGQPSTSRYADEREPWELVANDFSLGEWQQCYDKSLDNARREKAVIEARKVFLPKAASHVRDQSAHLGLVPSKA